MATTMAGSSFEVDHGPDWLFVRPILPGELNVESLADQVWSMIECNMVHRCVLELDRVELLRSSLVAQLVKLKKKMHQHGGILRISGLNSGGQEVLRICRLGEQLHSFPNRAEAVLGPRSTPGQPR